MPCSSHCVVTKVRFREGIGKADKTLTSVSSKAPCRALWSWNWDTKAASAAARVVEMLDSPISLRSPMPVTSGNWRIFERLVVCARSFLSARISSLRFFAFCCSNAALDFECLAPAGSLWSAVILKYFFLSSSVRTCQYSDMVNESTL